MNWHVQQATGLARNLGQLAASSRRVAMILLVVALFAPSVIAWAPTGHHMVGVVAYELLSEADREVVMDLLGHVPEFDRYFDPPSAITDSDSINRWRIGVAGAWPDIIRGMDLDRPTWHYQLAASYVIGDARPPTAPGPLPKTATLQTQQLYLEQAVELCEKIFADPSQPKPDRAIALCWMLHLYADGHQPCHSGSLYAPALPDGDRGANRLRFQDGGNLHAAWDNLLGGDAVASDVRRRTLELGNVRGAMALLHAKSNAGDDWFLPSTWLRESVQLASTHVYTDEVTGPIIAASRDLTDTIPPYRLSRDYFRAAGNVARQRIKMAGYRVAFAIRRGIAAEM